MFGPAAASAHRARMRVALFPCSACERHIRVDHHACPFCAAPVAPGFGAKAVPPLRGRLDRVATFTFALSLAAGCGAVKDEPAADAGVATTSAAGDGGAVRDGAVSFDGGARDAAVFDGRVDDDGGVMAEYGQPPSDGGACCPIYGLSPPFVPDGGR